MNTSDNRSVESLLPVYLMGVCFDELIKDGVEPRLDVRNNLNRAARTILEREPPHARKALGAEVIGCANSMLRELGETDSKARALSVALWTAMLVDEHRHPDPGDQAVLTSVMVIGDAREFENPETAGLMTRALANAKKLLRYSDLLGLY